MGIREMRKWLLCWIVSSQIGLNRENKKCKLPKMLIKMQCSVPAIADKGRTQNISLWKMKCQSGQLYKNALLRLTSLNALIFFFGSIDIPL
ncbi:uncharacterized protein [Nicotiana sylvestris]|uniref:Uncharacterized protein LOC104222965 isoform X2 n=1 Tax=Nicotiana sylvestris TaxID=4096 RepID=A0A1U7WD83_NICSY|nr:PREDICTED: uncharacterized protein LOC104222965 isoform X2 [Nicotiana sylvestris]